MNKSSAVTKVTKSKKSKNPIEQPDIIEAVPSLSESSPSDARSMGNEQPPAIRRVVTVGTRPSSSPAAPSKVTQTHLQHAAILYVRQSTSAQLRDHQESTQRQYQLVHRLEGLGWPGEQIIVIDDDLGISGSGSQQRPGFQRLLTLVTQQKVGIVLGLEMSRLARNSKDWHDLFEVCAIYGVLIADEDAIFDTNDPNDRLILGMKGIIAEMELHTMKVRLERGRLNKAERGELFHDVPVGYVKNDAGLPEFDPDESACRAMKRFFELFDTIGTASGLFHHLHGNDIKLPFRGDDGRLDWRCPAKTTVYGLLKHPLYAGAFGYGRTKRYGGKRRHAQQQQRKHLPPEQWKVLKKDCCPAYISWQQYESNQQRMQNNNQRRHASGPPRSGAALLAGLVFCDVCGRRLSPLYGSNGRGSYHCGRHRTMAGVDPCHSSIACHQLDDFITEKILEALQPSSIELSVRVVNDEVSRRSLLEQTHVDVVHRSRYDVDLAQRRYEQVDPANRLVASNLELSWEEALRQLTTAEAALTDFRQQQSPTLSEPEQQQIQDACRDITKLWNGHGELKDKKELARLLIDRVVVHVSQNSERVTISIVWAGGFESHHQIIRTVMNYRQLENYEQLLERTLELTLQGRRSSAVADILQQEGFRTPRRQQRISAAMVTKLLCEPRCHRQLNAPEPAEHEWLAEDLAASLGLNVKRLKHWVTRGWAVASQRPFGRKWLIWANERELERLQQLAKHQSRPGGVPPSIELRTPTPNARKEQ